MKPIREVNMINQLAEERLISIKQNIAELTFSKGNNTSADLQKLENEKDTWEEILLKSENKDVLNGTAIKYNNKLFYNEHFEFLRIFESKIISAAEIGIDESPFIQERDKWLKSQNVTVREIECAMELFENRYTNGGIEFEFNFNQEVNITLVS